MYLKSGYKTVTGVQLVNALSLLERKRITFRCFRVYLATFALTAIREAASRTKAKAQQRGKGRPPHYQISELARLCALTEGKVRRDIRTLEGEGLLQFSASEIRHRVEALPEAVALLSLVRSPTRPLPIPRAELRFLARAQKRSLTTVMIAYMLRGLTLSRRGGEVSGRGSAKLSWIADVSGVSDRGAAYARKELIHLGWISQDTGSTQRKLNRHGAYFAINLAWSSPSACFNRKGNFAALGTKKGPVFAPPIEDRKTPYGSKNQKTSEAGLFEKGGREEEEKASLANVKREDLFSLSRCETLYWHAVTAGLISHSEHSALNFLSAAVRARSAKNGDPARIFVGIVKGRLWTHITAEQEDVARRGLSRCREQDPAAFRLPMHERTDVADAA